jgi:DNA-directed RNA polymerase subunit RPC12/RpoP
VTDGAPIRCPFCTSTNTELLSLFGQQLLTVQYYCRGCKTPFERVRDADVIADAVERERGTRSRPEDRT